ncbi:MAG TPA: hypothetical protein VLI54_07250 [Bacillota bacterium]|nr:hypothetical protein [Bacillota bacterium]
MRPIDQGDYCQVTVSADKKTTIKTSRDTYKVSTAREIRQHLLNYSYDLLKGPLKTARFLGAHVLESGARGDRFVVRHSQETVQGTRLDRLPYEERMLRTAAVIAAMLSSPSRPRRPDLLLAPLDAKPANFIVTPKGEPVLVDVYPPFYWDAQDQVRYGGYTRMNDQEKLHANQYYGSQVGVAARLAALAIGLDTHTPPAVQIQAALDERAWHDQLLPDNIPDGTRQQIWENTQLLLTTRLESEAPRSAA